MNFDAKGRMDFFASHYLFKALDTNELTALADKVGVITVKPGKEIYRINDPALNVYFVFTGKIRMTRIFPKDPPVTSTLSEGDVCGEQALDARRSHYQETVEAEDQSILFLLSAKDITELCDEHPRFRTIFDLILNSVHLQQKKRFPWKNEGEYVIYVARRNRSTLFTGLIPPFAVIVLGFLGTLVLYTLFLKGETSLFGWFGLVSAVCLLWMIWKVFDWFNDYYVVTNQRLLVLEKVLLFYEGRHETPLEAIQSLTTASELFGRWLTFGTVQIRTYTGEIIFPGIDLPELVIDLIEQYSLKAKEKQNKEDHRRIEGIIRERLHISGTRATRQQEEHPEFHKEQPALHRRGLFASLFSLKEINGDTITYRTHWFILATKLLAPTVFCFVVLVLVILGLNGTFTLLPLELTALGGSLLILIGWGWWIYEFLDWHNDIYIVNPQQVIDINRTPLGHEEQRSAPLKNIQTIEYKRIGIFGLLFNYGTVFIRVGDSELTFDYVPDPSMVQKEIFAHFMQFTLNEKKADIAAENERMAEWIEAYHRVTNSNGHGKREEQDRRNQVQ
jgi:hypothetical protein